MIQRITDVSLLIQRITDVSLLIQRIIPITLFVKLRRQSTETQTCQQHNY